MIRNFLAGISGYFSALRLIPKLKLWKFLFAPALLSFVLGFLILGSAWKLSGPLGSFLVQWYPFETGASIVAGITGFASGFFILLIGIVLYKNLIMIVVSPFMSPLSQKVEEHLTGEQFNTKFKITSFSKSLLRGLRISLRNIGKELFFVILLFPLSLIPGIGVVFMVLLFIVQSYYAGFGNLDYSLDRHFNYKESVNIVKNNRSLSIGNGTVFMLLLMTGVGFLFAPPLATIAATVSHVKQLPRAGKNTV